MTSIAKFNFSKDDTNQAKGLALLLLLWHHLFYTGEGGFGTCYIGNVEIVQQIGLFGKVCVGIFVFLSGYGLYRSQMGKQTGLKSFYLKHYSKLYETYWLIWLIFVPISIFVFGRTFVSVYPENTWLHIVLNFFGLQYTMIDFGYNATWWFMTCIITLYFIYPFLKILVDKFGLLLVLLVFVFSVFSINILCMGFQPFAAVEEYLLTFTIGIIAAKYDIFVKIKELKYNVLLKQLVIIIFFILFVYARFQLGKKALILTDGIISYLIIQFMFLFSNNSKILIFIGKHSFNVFLFHTFIFHYFFRDLLYSLHYPVLIFLSLMLVCLAISVGIDYVKRMVKLEEITSRVSGLRFKNDIMF